MTPGGSAAHVAGFDLGLHDGEISPEVRRHPKVYAEESFPDSGFPEAERADFIRGYIAGVGGRERPTRKLGATASFVREMNAKNDALKRAREAARKLVAAKSDRPWTTEECAALAELCAALGVEVP